MKNNIGKIKTNETTTNEKIYCMPHLMEVFLAIISSSSFDQKNSGKQNK